MARKPAKSRVFVSKKRGEAKFIEQNSGLIRNVAKENGLCSYSVEVGDYLKPEITPELIALTKQKKVEVVKLKVAENRVTPWDQFRNLIQKVDRIQGTQVWTGLMIWMKQNPTVGKLNNTKRLTVLKGVAKKMMVEALKSDKIFLPTEKVVFLNRNDINDYVSGAPSAKPNTVHKFK